MDAIAVKQQTIQAVFFARTDSSETPIKAVHHVQLNVLPVQTISVLLVNQGTSCRLELVSNAILPALPVLIQLQIVLYAAVEVICLLDNASTA